MKIAIIGSGISGLSTAFYLSKFSDITLFEKNKNLVVMQILMILILKIKIFQLIVDLLSIIKKIIQLYKNS